MTLKEDAKFKEKLTGSLKNDIRNLVNFHASSRKPEDLHFDGLLLSEAELLARCSLLVTFCSLLVARYILLVACYFLLVPRYHSISPSHVNITQSRQYHPVTSISPNM